MKSISKRGKVFTGKFAETAARLGLAEPVDQDNEQGNVPAQSPKKGRKPKSKK
jgi:hypothetical protein